MNGGWFWWGSTSCTPDFIEYMNDSLILSLTELPELYK